MPRGHKLSSLVGFVSETKSFKNTKHLYKVMRVHTRDYIEYCFPFLILIVWGKKDDRQ